MKTKTKLFAALSPAVALIAFGAANAAETEGTLAVSATVLNTCIVATTPASFANVGLTDATGNGTVTVTCTNTAPFTVALGSGGSNDISNRQMLSPANDVLGYQLYTTAANTTVWGDDTTGETVTGNGPAQTLTVYGATTTTPTAAGVYTDTVTVTVTY